MSEKNCIVCNKPLKGQQKMYCSNTCKQKYHYTHNSGNTYYYQTMRALKRKLALIDYKGGQCEICGYNNNLAALEFHHIDPDLKKFQLDAKHLSNSKWEIIKEEADKCQLLCARCHREIHNPGANINFVRNMSSPIFQREEIVHTKPCKNCGTMFNKTDYHVFCSTKCKEEYRLKQISHYPSLKDVQEKYKELKTWDKVAKYFKVSRKVISGIRKNKYVSVIQTPPDPLNN